MKRKITVTTGTRAEYGILRSLIKEIERSKKLELSIIVTGMHLSKKHGYTIQEIQNDGFKNLFKISMIPRGNSTFHMSTILGEGIIQFSKIFRKIKPDINVFLGDRDEALASAIAAYHMNIPNAHIHGGDKTMAGIDEYNRHAMTKMSNIHFAGSTKSMNRILKMGEKRKYVFLTGSPSIDEVAQQRLTDIEELEKKFHVNFEDDVILFLQHPVTTQTNQTELQIQSSLNALLKIRKQTIAIAPNSDAGNFSIFKNLKIFSQTNSFLKLYSSIPRVDYLGLIKYSSVLVGNSSSGMIEGSYFNTPVVNIGIRQKDREYGKNVINVSDFKSNLIYNAIMKSLKIKNKLKLSSPYGKGNSSKKIVKILETIPIDEKLIQKQISY